MLEAFCENFRRKFKVFTKLQQIEERAMLTCKTNENFKRIFPEIGVKRNQSFVDAISWDFYQLYYRSLVVVQITIIYFR